MSNLFQIGELLKPFEQKNKGINIHYLETRIQGGIVHTFFVNVIDIELLESKWKEVANFLSIHFQNNLDNEFEKWNIYIIYLCGNEVSKDLRNKLENDKFSSRKIVEDQYTGSLANEELKKLITKHIVNDDLDNIVSSNDFLNIPDKAYVPKNESLWNVIPDDNIKGDTEKQSKILNHIINTIQHENKKS